MKYLPLYYEWMNAGELPWRGLCRSLDSYELFYLFEDDNIGGYWGYDGTNIYSSDIWHNDKLFYEITQKFTPLRQNIVLLLAAMNNEL